MQGARASIMIHSVDRGTRQPLSSRSPELDFFDRVRQTMEKLGYQGDWDLSFRILAGRFGDFEKELRSLDDVEREWRVLDGLSFGP